MHPRDNGHQVETGSCFRHDVRSYFIFILPLIFFILGHSYGSSANHHSMQTPTMSAVSQKQDDGRSMDNIPSSSQKNEIEVLLNQAVYEQNLDWAQKAINTLPLSFILDRAEAYTGIPVEVMEDMDNPRDFVSGLVGIAAKGTILESEQGEALFGDMVFHGAYGKAYASNVFAVNDNVIFANFALLDYPDDKVLVKWYRMSDKKILLYQQHSISSLAENFVWIRSFNGFQAGQYRVEIYGLSQELPLLASGNYVVGHFE